MKTPVADFLSFKAAHSQAFTLLHSYCRDDKLDAEGLARLVTASNLEEMRKQRACLNRYLACSVYIDNLHTALTDMASPSS